MSQSYLGQPNEIHFSVHQWQSLLKFDSLLGMVMNEVLIIANLNGFCLLNAN